VANESRKNPLDFVGAEDHVTFGSGLECG